MGIFECEKNYLEIPMSNATNILIPNLKASFCSLVRSNNSGRMSTYTFKHVKFVLTIFTFRKRLTRITILDTGSAELPPLFLWRLAFGW